MHPTDFSSTQNMFFTLCFVNKWGILTSNNLERWVSDFQVLNISDFNELFLFSSWFSCINSAKGNFVPQSLRWEDKNACVQVLMLHVVKVKFMLSEEIPDIFFMDPISKSSIRKKGNNFKWLGEQTEIDYISSLGKTMISNL